MSLDVDERAALLRAARSELGRLKDHQVYLHGLISAGKRGVGPELAVLEVEIELLSTAVRAMWTSGAEARPELDKLIEDLCKKYSEYKRQ
jgi:hypothetical protein